VDFVPEYVDLVRRALLAQVKASHLHLDSRRTRDLARLLREARTGDRLLLHCAWCGRLEIGGEWLRLEAIGSGQFQIHEAVVKHSTHGICPDCMERVQREADITRNQTLRSG